MESNGSRKKRKEGERGTKAAVSRLAGPLERESPPAPGSSPSFSLSPRPASWLLLPSFRARRHSDDLRGTANRKRGKYTPSSPHLAPKNPEKPAFTPRTPLRGASGPSFTRFFDTRLFFSERDQQKRASSASRGPFLVKELFLFFERETTEKKRKKTAGVGFFPRVPFVLCFLRPRREALSTRE